MPAEVPSPIDLPAPPLARLGLGWATAAITTAAAILLVANAVSLRDWIEDQPPGPAQAATSATVDRWVAATDGIAAGRPRAWLHKRWKAIEAARF